MLSGSGTQKLYHCNSHIIGVKYLPILEPDEMGSPFVSVSAGYAAGDQGNPWSILMGLFVINVYSVYRCKVRPYLGVKSKRRIGLLRFYSKTFLHPPRPIHGDEISVHL